MRSSLLLWLATSALLCSATRVASSQQVLVFDSSTHQSAQAAAEARFPGLVTLSTSANFDTLVSSQSWDLVLVNSPGERPTSWLGLAFHLLGGGRAVMSHWDYGDLSYPGMAELLAVSDVSVNAELDLTGKALIDSDTSNTFFGIPMPNSDWHSHWIDDGDSFNLLAPSAVGLAHIGLATKPVIVLGNNGRSMLMPAMDEVGDSWITAGYDVALWDNVIDVVWNDGGCLHYHGALGLNPGGFHCTFNPQAGYPWRARIDPVPTQGVSTAATVVILGFGGATDGITLRGYEQLILPPYVMHAGFEFHKIPVAPGLVGSFIRAQGMRIEIGPNGENYYVLLNSLDLVVG
ncbi:MAG: hypothetical protein ACI9D0_000809 [Bacteroidia bacterium]|jgi:hypothetical protein